MACKQYGTMAVNGITCNASAEPLQSSTLQIPSHNSFPKVVVSDPVRRDQDGSQERTQEASKEASIEASKESSEEASEEVSSTWIRTSRDN
jgi:hypothetical protein